MARISPRTIGRFVWNTTSGQWQWDVGMYELHGYRAGAVAVTTELVLEHKHDAYRDHAAGVLQRSASGDQRFSNYHRIVDLTGRQRIVLTVGESHADVSRPRHRVSSGFMVDVTQDEIDVTHDAVQRARRGAGPIQQSLGLLMGSLGLSEEAAFSVLARVASHHNVKVRDLASRFMAAAVSTADDPSRDVSRLLMGQATALAVERAHRGRPVEPSA